MSHYRDLGLAIVTGLILASPCLADTWEESIETGEKAYKNHHIHKAEQALLAALKETEKLDPEDVKVARTLNDLAVVYNEEGRNKEAEPYYLRALKIRELKLGHYDLAVADTLNNLGNLYKDIRNYPEAEKTYKRAFEIYKKDDIKGATDEYLAMTCNNMGRLYIVWGKIDEAIPLLKRSIEIGDKALGEDNEHVVDTVGKLAKIYEQQGNTAAAKPLYRRYLKHVLKAMGLKEEDPKAMEEVKIFAQNLRDDNDIRSAEMLEKAIQYETSHKK